MRAVPDINPHGRDLSGRSAYVATRVLLTAMECDAEVMNAESRRDVEELYSNAIKPVQPDEVQRARCPHRNLKTTASAST
jgi:hypothetical protein